MSTDDSQVYPKTADSAIKRHKERGTDAQTTSEMHTGLLTTTCQATMTLKQSTA